MEKHGSESYFVVGEGLLSESAGGREETPAAAAAAAAASATPRARPSAPPFRFSRLGPNGRTPAGRGPAQAARPRDGEGRRAPSHDPGRASPTSASSSTTTSRSTRRRSRSASNVAAGGAAAGAARRASTSTRSTAPARRTPRRRGSTRRRRPSEDGQDDARAVRTLRGRASTCRAARAEATAASARRVIPDPRNDENLAVAQTHLAFIRFHNRVVDTLPAVPPAPALRASRSEIVVKHYQWMIRGPTSCRESCDRRSSTTCSPTAARSFEVGADATDGADDADRVLRRRVPPRAQHDPPGVRLEPRFPDRHGTLDLPVRRSPARAATSAAAPRLPSNWIADFRRLYDFAREPAAADLAAPRGRQPRQADRHVARRTR